MKTTCPKGSDETTPDAAATTLAQAETKWSARVEKLQAEVEALKLDKDRMDWLDKNNPYLWANTRSETYRMKVDAAMNKNKESR